jgi:type II secretory pathway pseudopilin PulG
MSGTAPSRRQNASEEGYVLVAVIFMMVILILSLAVALPKVRADIQRDREEETMERGKQYIRAIQLYYKKFNAYPPNVDALVKTNNIRFLRKKYIDPTTGKDEWKPIMWGQNKTPMAMGFFGQPLAAAVGGGIGPSGGNLGGATGGSGTGGLFNSSGSSSIGTSSIGSTPSGTTGGTNGAGAATGGTDANGNQTGGTGTTTSSGSAFSSSSNPTGTGQTFGGAGIIGFSPQSPKQSILVYKKKNHYNEWEFLYSPLLDQQQMASGTGLNGQGPGQGTTNPIGGGSSITPTGGGIGGGTSTTPSGGGSSTPVPPPPPTSPNQ